MTAAVLTISDSAANGTRPDTSGPALADLLTNKGFNVIATDVVPDERGRIEAAIISLSEVARLVITTGGTGIAPRDVTPEATTAVCDRLIPGFSELMRAEGLKKIERAVLSRGVCGSRGQTLIINLPGNPKGAQDSLITLLPLIPHSLDLLAGKTQH
jgi:molybdenum cofactor synthesis domain-containing protein